MGPAVAATGEIMSRGVSQVSAGGDQGIAASGAALDQVVGQAKAGYAQAEAATGASLGEGASETSRLRTDAVNDVHGRVAEGQAQVDQYVASKGPPVHRSVWGAIGNWFAEQFKDLVDMLTSPAFWVGLVVTLVLFPVMGPGALVVGGLAAGVVSGIQQNVQQGKHWYDPHNIIVGAAIGALSGAAMAFGIGVIVGLGLEGLAATAAFMGLSALVGIVVNVATGQRWDKGLLANLFLAWLFTRIFGTKAPEGAPEGGSETQQGGRTNTEVPGLRGNIDPSKPPDGWQFIDTVRTVGAEKVVTTRVIAPDGSGGHTIRGLNTATGEFILHEAFLDNIPRNMRWVATDPAMVEGRGTPLETYMTLRAQRILETDLGTSLTVTAPTTVKISTIINVRTVAELAEPGPRRCAGGPGRHEHALRAVCEQLHHPERRPDHRRPCRRRLQHDRRRRAHPGRRDGGASPEPDRRGALLLRHHPRRGAGRYAADQYAGARAPRADAHAVPRSRSGRRAVT